MAERRRTYCVYGCTALVCFNKPIHRFPNPIKNPDLYSAWIEAVGIETLKDMDPIKVYANKRLCDNHFEDIYKISTSRLTPFAIPAVNLHCIQATEKDFVPLDHSYTRSVRVCTYHSTASANICIQTPNTGSEKLFSPEKTDNKNDSEVIQNDTLTSRNEKSNPPLKKNCKDITNVETSEIENIGIRNVQTSEIENIGIRNVQTSEIEIIGIRNVQSSETESMGIRNVETSETENIGVRNVQSSETENISVRNVQSSETECIGIRNVQSSETENICMSNIGMDKIYKVVSVDNNIILVEKYKNELNSDSSNDNVGSPLRKKYLEDIFNIKPNKDAKHPTTINEVNFMSSLDEYLYKRYPTKDMVTEEVFTTDLFSVVEVPSLDVAAGTSLMAGNKNKIMKSHVIPSKLTRIVKDFMDHFPEIVNYDTYKDHDILVYGQNGTALVLIPENKYRDIKAKLEELIKIKKENSVFKIKLRRLKALCNKQKQDMNSLQQMERSLRDLYGDKQLKLMTKQQTHNIPWSSDDIKKAIYLYQITTPKAYNFLRSYMKYPLPCPKTVELWMTERNISFKTRRKLKLKGTTIANNQAANIQIIDGMSTQGPGTQFSDGIQYYLQECHTQSQDNYESQICSQPYTVVLNNDNVQSMEVEEIQQSVAMIVDNQGYIIDNTVSGQIVEKITKSNDLNNTSEEQMCGQDVTNVRNNKDYHNNSDYIGNDIGNNNTRVSNDDQWDLNNMYKMQKRKVKRKLLCQVCVKPFETREELRQHVPLHYYNTFYTTYLDVRSPFVCEFCNEQVRKRDMLVRHHILHLGITEFKCWHPGCKYVSKSKYRVLSHKKCHTVGRHACPQCSAVFPGRRALRVHRARAHCARGLYPCTLCHGVYRSQYTHYRHMKTHDKPPTYKCVESGCSESFYSKRSLALHKLSHRTTLYQCHLCPPATFNNEFQLKRHLERHETHQVSQCERCKMIFDSYADYYVHVKTYKHADTRATYTCACDMQFNSMRKLQAHKKNCKEPIVENEIIESNVANESDITSEVVTTPSECEDVTIEETIVDMDDTLCVM